VSTSSAMAVFPMHDFLQATSRRLLSAAAQSVYQVHLSYLSQAINPYSHDSTSNELQSGVTGVSLATSDGVSFNVSGLTAQKAIRVGVKLVVASASPKCLYWAGSQFSSEGVLSFDLSDEPAVSAQDDFVLCTTNHLSDFVMIDGCDEVQDCNSHGLCAQDSTCRCTCGWYNHNCTEVHIGQWADSTKNRFFTNGAFQLKVHPSDVGGHVAMVKQHSNVSTCTGAGSAPLNSFDGNAAKLPVIGNGYAVFPTTPDFPLDPGRYTVCSCNAEKANDTKYGNCSMDCSYHIQTGQFLIVATPRVGPILDLGNARILSDLATTFRLTAGSTPSTSLVNGDKVFVASSCSGGPAQTLQTNRTTVLPLGGRELTADFSVFVKLPALSTTTMLALKWCFTTVEMGASPAITEYAELPDTLTVIAKPHLAAVGAVAAVSNTSPNYLLNSAAGAGTNGVRAGDHVFFQDATFPPCQNITMTASSNASLPIRAIEFNDAVLGPVCTPSEAQLLRGALVVTYTASSQRAECGEVAAVGGIGSSGAWCAASHWVASAFDQSFTDQEYLLTNNLGPYLQLELNQAYHIAGLQVQGHPTERYWVKQFAISTSMDGISWTPLTTGGTLAYFDGNRDISSTITIPLESHTILSRFVRVYPKVWHQRMAMRATILGCPTGVYVQLPTAPSLTASGASASRLLRVCYATRRSEAMEYAPLDYLVHMVPQPTDPGELAFSVQRGSFFHLPIVNSNNHADAAGAMVILVPALASCTSLISSQVVPNPKSQSGIIVLGADTTVTPAALEAAGVNLLEAGRYRMCYATKSSGGDFDSDWNTLSTFLDIVEDSRQPALSVASDVGFGADMPVHWRANNGLDGRLSQSGDWLGLFKKGSCRQVEPGEEATNSDQQQMQNKCYISSVTLPIGVEAGSVSFPFSDIKAAGSYEVRYFMGDSISGQGYVCRGLQEGTVSNYLLCTLEAAAQSTTIEVKRAGGKDSFQHDGTTLPGLEYSHLM